MRLRISIIAATLLAAVSACSEPSSSSFVSHVSFDYAGPVSGRYEVRAGPPEVPTSAAKAYVEGSRADDRNDVVLVESVSPIAGTDLFSFVRISAPDAPGEYDLATCEDYGECQFAEGGINYDRYDPLVDGKLGWRLDQGVVKVLMPGGAMGERVRATFSGSGRLYRYSEGEGWTEIGRITVANGKLEVDVP